MRPRDSAAAPSEPAAMPTAKMRLIAISTSIPPPMRDLTDDRNERERDNARPSRTSWWRAPQPGVVVGARPHRIIRHVEAMTFSGPSGSRRADAMSADEARRAVAGERDDHQLRHDTRGRAALRRREAADDEPQNDRGEGGAFDQCIGRDELLAPQVVGQNAVFDRPEQRRDAAEAEQCDIEQCQRRSEDEARRGDRLDTDLGELQPPRRLGVALVVRIGDLAAERGKRDRRQDERHRGDQDFRAAVAAPEAEQDQHRQHVADEIVVERREELAPEQRREAPRGHQGAEHDGSGVQAAREERMDAEIAPRVKQTNALSLQDVADADEDLLGDVALFHREPGLRIDQQTGYRLR